MSGLEEQLKQRLAQAYADDAKEIAEFQRHIAQQQAAREAKIGAWRTEHPPVPEAMLAVQARAPGNMFSRETICAIIRGQIAITHDSHLKDLLTIFENLEGT